MIFPSEDLGNCLKNAVRKIAIIVLNRNPVPRHCFMVIVIIVATTV